MADSDERQPYPPAALADLEAIEACWKALSSNEDGEEARPLDPLDAEPTLQRFLGDELLKVCGRMGLAGAPPGVIRGVRQDVRRLLRLTVKVLRDGHRRMLDGLLPVVNGDDLAVRPTAFKPEEDYGEG